MRFALSVTTGMSPSGKNFSPRILFSLYGGMGDVIEAISVVRALSQKHSVPIDWCTHVNYVELVDGLPFVRRVYGQEGYWHTIEPPSDLLLNYDLHFFPQGSRNSHAYRRARKHMIDWMADQCGVHVNDYHVSLPGDREITPCSSVVLCPLCKSAGNLSLEHYCFMVNILQDYFEKVFIVSQDPIPELPGTMLAGRSLLEVRDTIAASRLYVGGMTGPSWIASTTTTPIICYVDDFYVPERKLHTLHPMRPDAVEFRIKNENDFDPSRFRDTVENILAMEKS